MAKAPVHRGELPNNQPLFIQSHVTPVNIALLQDELANHHDRIFVSSLINDLLHGARSGYDSPRTALVVLKGYG